MASDTTPGDFKQGNNVWLNVQCESIGEFERLFSALGEGGTVRMPLHDSFGVPGLACSRIVRLQRRLLKGRSREDVAHCCRFSSPPVTSLLFSHCLKGSPHTAAFPLLLGKINVAGSLPLQFLQTHARGASVRLNADH
jgi:hypothetical protein